MSIRIGKESQILLKYEACFIQRIRLRVIKTNPKIDPDTIQNLSKLYYYFMSSTNWIEIMFNDAPTFYVCTYLIICQVVKDIINVKHFLKAV